jgi:Golgi SNAP receptor complex protein 2
MNHRKDHESISMGDDYSVKERGSLMQSHREIDDILSVGSETLSSLRHQRDTLKNTRTKMLDIGNALGMSNTVMRYIEKRASKDKVILYIGMVLFTLMMFLVWYYLL